MTLPERARRWGRPVGTLAGLLLAYYAYPVQLGSTRLALLELLLTAAGLALLGVMMLGEVARLRRGESVRSLPALATLLMLVVVGFSFAFFLLSQNAPDQMTGVATRTDALYFTLTTMTTVGYGDVHASGQAARGMVILLIVFNVVVVASLLRGVTARGFDRPAATRQRDPDDPEPPREPRSPSG